jgi:superfamily II DNA or RNA helicase
MENKFCSTFDYKLIYIFRINDEEHKNLLKIGDATIHTTAKYDSLPINCHELNVAAKNRIDSYTSTAGVVYELLHTEIAVYEKNKQIYAFRDHNVHDVLTRSGIKKKFFDTNKKQNEWFETDLNTAINAINAVKDEKVALNNNQITKEKNPIIFRPEQRDAIEKTLKVYKTGNKMLWNAKMRFGKTVCALQIAKILKFKKTVIITHRPAVNDGWWKDFDKIFYDTDDFVFASRTKGSNLNDILNDKTNKKFIYFASMQDLRGSNYVGGNYEKNDLIFNINWDYVIVDEAHEGTKTKLGTDVLEAIIKPNSNNNTKLLELSGTPFNLITDYDDNCIYTWDYIMEQEAKTTWPLTHFGDTNPYEELPRMNIFTYHLEKYLTNYIEVEDKAFNFKEFFRTWTGDIKKDLAHIPEGYKIGDFVHEEDIISFLNLICKKDENSNYPFSTDEYRSYFRHTLWMLPGVKEARALSKLLHKHSVFSQFEIVNVAGDGDEETDSKDALNSVREKMTNHPENTYTITLSCGRLTVGVSVPEWTAVLMLSGSYSTSASQYLQTIFRVQTPANIDGKIKDNCYVFDFAPDRTLKMVAESVQLSSSHSKGNIDSEILLGKFLNYCPVIAVDNSTMKTYKVSALLQELKKAYSERVVRNGFDDTKLYNEELFNISDGDLVNFEELKRIIGSSKQTKNVDNITINNEGFSDEQLEEINRIEKKKKKEMTPEEKEKLEQLKSMRDNRLKAISILRGISIRIPLLVYGIDKDIDMDITVDNFADKNLIDDLSWEEFMPTGVTRETFKKFAKYYDKDVFVAASRRIRYISKSADDLEPTDRVIKISNLFSTFKNPDKETVLTPWKAVNTHMRETLGGYSFINANDEPIDNPIYVDNGKITNDTLEDKEVKLLEINSKTGLYPLYLVYSIYRNTIRGNDYSFEEKQRIWDFIVENNMFVICKTPMAKSITRRTLVGYRNVPVNTRFFEDLINQLKDTRKQDNFINKVTRGNYWNRKEEFMKFKAIVGNPPYQGLNHQQVYPYFYLTSLKLADYVSLIFPVGWQQPKNGNNLKIMNTTEVKSDKQIMFIDNRQNVFPGVSGAEWVNVILWNKNYNNQLNGKQKILTNGKDPNITKLECEYTNSSKPIEIKKLDEIVKSNKGFRSITEITTKRNPFGISTDFFKKYHEYGVNELLKTPSNINDIKIYGAGNNIYYIPHNFKFPKTNTSVNKYKVFVAYAWGNMSETAGLGGAFSDVIIGSPNEVATETYLVSGIFDDKETARKHAKYLMTKFARALLYVNKNSQHSTQAWGSVPRQDYTEDWWNKSIKEIDAYLMKKYDIPADIQKFVYDNFQTKNESNIINF